jgi:hypothetical protein
MGTARRTKQRAAGNSARRAATSRRKPSSTAHARPRAGTTSRLARTLVDHDEIRRWAESRGGKPTAVKGTSRAKADVGMIRLDFPGYSGEGKLQPIGWDEWFAKFDAANLALVVQDKTSGGEISHFNKLVAREGPGTRSDRRRAGARSHAGARR